MYTSVRDGRVGTPGSGTSHICRMSARCTFATFSEAVSTRPNTPQALADWLSGKFPPEAKTARQDAGIHYLMGSKEIETLDLASTLTTDRGLREIGRLGSLRRLVLSGTRVSNEAYGRSRTFGNSLLSI